MLPFYELMNLNYVHILIVALSGWVFIIIFGFLKMIKYDDIYT